MKTRYMKPRSQKREDHTWSGTGRGGKLRPIDIVAFQGSESGVVRQTVNVELEPIAGRLITNVTARVRAVYVPVLAADSLNNADNDHPGNHEIFRERLLAGEDIFPLEGETALSQVMGVVPRPVDGSLYVSALARLAHNAAVNYLRQQKYVKATQITAANTDVTPALFGATVLDRFNAVLDPEDRVNGAVHLTGEIPIAGLGLRATRVSDDTFSGVNVHASDNQTNQGQGWYIDGADDPLTTNRAQLFIEQDPNNPTYPNVRADFALGTGQQLSLQDFYTAERMDELTRLARRIVDANPEHGEDIVARMAHGLQVDTGKVPFVLYEKTVNLTRGIKSAMDGGNLDQNQTNTFGQLSYTVPVPANEFGGVVISFLEVLPEEVIENQPHPVLSSAWTAHNHMADELAVDPVPVTLRELDASVAQADEGTIAMYVGNNHMKRNYSQHGFHRGVDETTVEHKSAMWRVALPLSVSPSNVLYPEDLDHYPFQLNGPTDDAFSYTVSTSAMIASPMILGPTPIEELEVIETEDLFEEGA